MEYQTYPEYNDSCNNWLGKTPSHWETTTIKRKFRIVNGSTPKSSESQYWDGDITWVTPADFSSNVQGYITKTRRKITLEGLKSCGTSLVPIGSIVVTTRAPIGGIAQARGEVCTNQGCKSLVVDTTNLLERFVYYVLVVSEKQLNALGLGTTFMELTKDALGYYPFALPHYEDQQKIANFLDYKTQQIDQLIEKKKALIEMLNEQRIAVITQAVTKGIDKDAKMKPSGVDWLGGVPEHWDVIKLRFLLKQKLTNGLFKKAEAWGNGFRVVNVFDVYVHNDIINESSLDRLECDKFEKEKFSAKFGDFFLVRSSLKLEGIGKSATVINQEEDMVFECHLVRGRPDLQKVHPRYLNLFLNSKSSRSYFVSMANTVTMTTIDQSKFKDLAISLPQYDEQRRIVEFIDKKINQIDAMITAANKVIRHLEDYRTSLITSAVTGKIDVRDFEIPLHKVTL